MNKIISLLLIFFSTFYSCVDSNLPKQSAFLRIEFPEPSYIAPNEIKLPIDFYYNLSAADINVINSKQFSLNYPKMNLIVDMSLNKITKREDLENELNKVLRLRSAGTGKTTNCRKTYKYQSRLVISNYQGVKNKQHP